MNHQIDWEGIEHEYRQGAASIREMARHYGCAASTISRHAEKHDWARAGAIDWAGVERDYRAGVSPETIANTFRCEIAAIRTRAEQKGWHCHQSAKSVPADTVIHHPSANHYAMPQETFSVNADSQANVVLRHRQDILRLRVLADELAQELACAALDSPAARIDGVNKLSRTLKTLIALERQAFSLDAPVVPSTGLSAESSEVLRRLKAKLEESLE